MTGHIYVLINPTFQHLVKVGQTSRDVEVRCAELSAVTGLPTPFIIAYKKECGNPPLAERLVHKELDLRGFRNKSNREFFDAPLSEVVDIIQFVFAENEDILSSHVKNEVLSTEQNSGLELIDTVWRDLQFELSLNESVHEGDLPISAIDDFAWPLINNQKLSDKLTFLIESDFLPAFPLRLAKSILEGDFKASASTIKHAKYLLSQTDSNYGLFPTELTRMILYIFCSPYISKTQIESIIDKELVSEVIPSARSLSISELVKNYANLKSTSNTYLLESNSAKQDISEVVKVLETVHSQKTISKTQLETLQSIIIKNDLYRAAQTADIASFFNGIEISFSGAGNHFNEEAKSLLMEIDSHHEEISNLFLRHENFSVFMCELLNLMDCLLFIQEETEGFEAIKQPLDKFVLRWIPAWHLAELDGVLLAESKQASSHNESSSSSESTRKLKGFAGNFPNISKFLISEKDQHFISDVTESECLSVSCTPQHDDVRLEGRKTQAIKTNGTCNICRQRIFMFIAPPNRLVMYNTIGFEWDPHTCIDNKPQPKRHFFDKVFFGKDKKSFSQDSQVKGLAPIQVCSPVKTKVSPMDLIEPNVDLQVFPIEQLWHVWLHEKVHGGSENKLTLKSMRRGGEFLEVYTNHPLGDVTGSILFKSTTHALTFDFNDCRHIEFQLLSDER